MKEYYDILNRRKPMEDVGDAFKGQADAMRPMNVGQRREQALMRGFGAGINMGARAVDEAKIREIEEDSKQMAMLTKELTMATGKNQLREQKIKSFIADQDSNLKLASDLIVKGKYDQLDILAPSIFNAYKEHTGTNLGEYLFSKNGHISFKTPDGKIETMEAKTLFNPIMNYIPPEDRGNYKGFATSYQAEELDAIVEARRLRNELLQSQSDNMKAHNKLYEAQAKEALRKAEIGTLTDKEKLTLTTNITKNRDYVEKEILPNLDANEKVLTLYDKLGNIIKENPNLVGSDYVTKVRRTIGEALGLDPALDYAKMTSIDFEKTLRPILGAQFTEKEGNRILGKYPSIEKNITALKQFLKEERPALIKNIVKQKAMYNAYNKDNSANILDENLLGDLNSEYKNYIYDKYGSEISLEIDNKDVDYKKLNNIKEKLGK